jgi:dUTP pyrophosphatase
MTEFEEYTSILNSNTNSNNNIFSNCDRYMLLRIHVSSNLNELKNMYLNAANVHNEKIRGNPFPDAGFDLFTPSNVYCVSNDWNKVNFGVQCAATMVCESGKRFNTGFYIYPRSSTGSKTTLRLANSVGIIDSGYRGNLMAVFDCAHARADYSISQYDKLVQICSPGLVPIYVEVVDSLGEETARGAGGFGSTGN